MKTVLVAAVALGILPGCSKKRELPNPPPIEGSFEDDFERSDLGDNWHATAKDAYQLVNGAVSAKGAYNKPLWLRKQLPDDMTLEITAWSNSPEGDIKVEVFGDGESYDPDRGSNMATGYVFIMGGWGNSKSIIARRDEHGVVGKDLVERIGPPVAKGQRYRWRIERSGSTIDWYVDDMETPFLHFEDKEPLRGEGHRYFAISNWQSDSWYDDLVVTAK